MATLKVVFKAIDEISSKFNEMTQSGERALGRPPRGGRG